MVSKVEDVIMKSLKEEYKKQLKYIENQCQRSSEELGIVYKDTVNMIEELNFNDATLLDFFMKTDGNVRVTKFDSIDSKRLDVKTSYDELLFNNNPIELKENTKYKIILIAVKEDE